MFYQYPPAYLVTSSNNEDSLAIFLGAENALQSNSFSIDNISSFSTDYAGVSQEGLSTDTGEGEQAFAFM